MMKVKTETLIIDTPTYNFPDFLKMWEEALKQTTHFEDFYDKQTILEDGKESK